MKTIRKKWRLGTIIPGWMRLAGIIVFISIHGLYAQRTLPTADQFDYAAGPLQAVGVDWTRVSGSGNDLTVTEGNVTCNGYLGALGRKATMTNGANDDLKLSFTPQNTNGTTIYCAFVLNVANNTGLNSTGAYCFILGYGVTNFAARMYIKGTGAGYQLGISKTTTPPVAWSAVLMVNTPHLVVMSYQILPGNSTDVASLWIDPGITTVEPPADFSVTTGVDFGSAAAMDGFFLRQATGSPNASVDDLSIALSWAELFQDPVYSESGTIGEGTFHNVKITGPATTVTMIGAVSVESELSIADGGFYPSGNSVTYGPDGTLTYAGSYVQNVNPEEFPAIHSPKNLVIDNPAGVILGVDREINGDLIVEAGSKFTIQPGITFTAGGDVILKGNESLLIRSDATGTGSFIDGGSVTGGGTAKVERFLTGYEEDEDMKYHFLSSPVAAQPVQPGFVAEPPDPAGDFYKWDEPSATWINSKTESGSWNPAFGGSFEPGRGYLAAWPSDLTKAFSGLPSSHPSGSPLSVTCSWNDPATGGGGGWNLAGNPYPSGIDWNMVDRGSGIDNALYYYDAQEENYRYYVEFLPGTGIGNGSPFIPAMQGFMVHANNTGDRTLRFDNSCRTHQGAEIYYKNDDPVRNMLKLRVFCNGKKDDLFIVLNKSAVPGFGGREDALKLFSLNPDIPQVWSYAEDGSEMAVNVMPDGQDLSVRLGFRPGKGGICKLTAEGMDHFDPAREILVEDVMTGKVFNTGSDPEYEFAAYPNDDPDRFRIHFHDFSSSETSVSRHGIRIFSSQGDIIVVTDDLNETAFVKVYDLYGRKIIEKAVPGSGIFSFRPECNPGLYLVEVSCGTLFRVERVIIRK